MSENNRIVWSEGLFLRPQHFQQQERYLERYVEGRAGPLRAWSWGFSELEIERDLLAVGKLGPASCARCVSRRHAVRDAG